MNFKLKIDLLKLRGARTAEKNGQKYVVIPTDSEGLFLGEKGCYLDLVAFQMSAPKYDDTHTLKVSLSKAQREANVDTPIIGGLRPLQTQGNAPQEMPNNVPLNDDDLPF